MSEEVVKFIFANQAEVDAAYAKNYTGTLCRAQIDMTVANGRIFTREWTPYAWKVKEIRGPAQRQMKDTWLTSPYIPRLTPKELP